MPRSRWIVLPVVLLALLLAACGGSNASDDGDGGNGGDESEAAVATATATATAEAEESEANGGNGGPSADDLDQLVDDLTPPNSSESSRTTVAGAIVVAFASPDSVDELRSFYERAIPDAGMRIFSTTDAQGVVAWVFAESEGSTFGGSVTVGPTSDGSDGSSVVVSVTGEGT